VEACDPQLPEFLHLTRRYDARERFKSGWYRHYRQMFARKSAQAAKLRWEVAKWDWR
jgi:hypothetical protein